MEVRSRDSARPVARLHQLHFVDLGWSEEAPEA